MHTCYHGNSELIMVPLNSELHKVKYIIININFLLVVSLPHPKSYNHLNIFYTFHELL